MEIDIQIERIVLHGAALPSTERVLLERSFRRELLAALQAAGLPALHGLVPALELQLPEAASNGRDLGRTLAHSLHQSLWTDPAAASGERGADR